MSVWSEGLGRQRSKLGKWIDRNGITQGQLKQWSSLGINTLTRVCSDPDYAPTRLTKDTIIDALVRNGYNVEGYDFW